MEFRYLLRPYVPLRIHWPCFPWAESSQCLITLSWERHETNEPKDDFLSSPWWSEGKFTTTSLFGPHCWSRWCEKVDGPALDFTTSQKKNLTPRPGQLPGRSYMILTNGKRPKSAPSLAHPPISEMVCVDLPLTREGMWRDHSCSASVSSCVKYGQCPVLDWC